MTQDIFHVKSDHFMDDFEVMFLKLYPVKLELTKKGWSQKSVQISLLLCFKKVSPCQNDSGPVRIQHESMTRYPLGCLHVSSSA